MPQISLMLILWSTQLPYPKIILKYWKQSQKISLSTAGQTYYRGYLIKAKAPTIIVGGELNELGSNAIYGKSDFVIAEACESDGSFLKYNPFISVVTNIEEDHFDYYKDMDELEKSFFKFISNTKDEGWIIINSDEIDKSRIRDKGKKKLQLPI